MQKKKKDFKHLMHINRNTCTYLYIPKQTQNKVKSTKLFHNILITSGREQKGVENSNNTNRRGNTYRPTMA